jgi:spermidine synthase
MLDVFPHLTLWTTELHEMLLVGSMEPIELDAERISRRFRTPSVAAALGEVGVGSPAALLALWVTDRAGLERYAANASPITDNHPVIEYAAWLREGELARVLPRVFEEASPVPVDGADYAMNTEIAAERRQLLAFYAAGVAAYVGDREGWAQAMGRVRAEGGRNPYYAWFLGGQ